MGIYFWPGVPNGTEATQEMDQMFGTFKSICYDNRELLYESRLAEFGVDAVLSFDDIGSIIFGGDVPLSEGETVKLQNAFVKGFSPELIRGAREKCGYVPLTRAALTHSRVRHQIIEKVGEDGVVDTSEDPIGELLLMIEKDNHEAAAKLVEAGYPEEAVNMLKKNANRVTAAQIEGREATRTLPNTRERQDALEKCKSAGQFFQITNGGEILNCSDMLLALERKEMKKESVRLQKRKAACEEFAAIKAKAAAILASTQNVEGLRNADLAAVIRYECVALCCLFPCAMF